ncbi:MAG: hypothetical protein PW789_17175 [Edaphobacter sp.]|uniref:hypothetical protein n=1 Tax=Edaphobacter sp. TaxID=1934404 RepID=UPI002385232B|nr:hypothetical protein [Edaphobacter sp.]MDE1178309.1 hypothetical protein [Edaphobacter sp.]
MLGLLLLLGAIVRIESYLFRRQAEHLMADFQALKLRQTKWPEAESLTHKWGKYGHYQGDCNASFCRYTITLRSPMELVEARFGRALDHVPTRQIVLGLFRLSWFLGGRDADLSVTFTVQDSIVLRKSAVFIYQVPPFRGFEGYALIATSGATSHLSWDGWTYSEQLAKHPYYKYTRPGGCSFCLMVNVSFTPDAPESEMRWLTTFNLACLTNWRPCRDLEDIYPASEGWHLYDWHHNGVPSATGNQENNKVTVLPVECRIPIFVRGREADQILSVTSLKKSQDQQLHIEVNEKATVRLDGVLKGSTGYKVGESIDVIASTYRYYDHFEYAPLKMETPLTPGEPFLLLSVRGEKKPAPLQLERCLVLPDTPEIRAELQRGIVQNDLLRYPDPHASYFIPD